MARPDELLEQVTEVGLLARELELQYIRKGEFDEMKMGKLIVQASHLCIMARDAFELATAMIHDLKEEKLDTCWKIDEIRTRQIADDILASESLRRMLREWADRRSGVNMRDYLIRHYLRQGHWVDPEFIFNAMHVVRSEMGLNKYTKQ